MSASHCFSVSQLMKPIPQTWFNEVASKEISEINNQPIKQQQLKKPQRETKIGKGKLTICKLQVSERN